MSHVFIIAFGMLLTASALAADESPIVEIRLSESTADAIKASGHLGAADAEVRAAQSKARSYESLLWPKLSLDASYRYATVVPNLPIPGPAVPFGDHQGYSFGPALSWTLWDGGSLRKGWRGQQSVAAARAEEKAQTERQVILAARLAYFNMLQAAEQQRLVADSVRLSLARRRDIERRRHAGAVSEIDVISAKKEVLALQLQFRRSQSELASALRDLCALVGRNYEADLNRPVDARIEDAEVISGEKPTARIRLESIEQLAGSFGAESGDQGRSEEPALHQHPRILAMDRQVESLRLVAESVSASGLPKVTLFAKSALEYPNGPNPEQVYQNTFGATLSWAFFDAGRIRHEKGEKQSLADAAEERKRQSKTDISRDLRKTLDQLAALKAQRETHRASIEQSEKLVKLLYGSYLAGKTSFLEVQSANLALLDAKISDRRNEIQILIQTSVLREITGEN